MRGALPFDFPPPASGLLKDRPTHMVGPDGLIDGQNMLLDPDGYYRPRYGYAPWKTDNPTEPLLGITGYIDSDGTNQYIGAGATNIWALIGGSWTSVLTGLNGDVDHLVSIVPFLQPFVDGAQTALISALVCNGKDPLKLWNKSLTNALELTPVHPTGGGNALAIATTPSFSGTVPFSNPGPNWFFTVAAANTGNVTLNINNIGAKPLRYINNGVVTELPAGYLQPNNTYNVSWDGTQFLIGFNLLAPAPRHICVLNGRIVGVNVTSGAVTVPAQVTWSSTFDGTVWPADNFQNMVDDTDELIAIYKIGFNAAVVHGRHSGYLCQGVFGGSDSQAFSFTPINGYKSGPCSPLVVVPWQGGQLWLAEDKRLWTTDGNSAQPFNGAISALLKNILDDSARQRFFAFEDIPERRIWFFLQQVGQTTSTAIVIGQDPAPHFETLQLFPTLFTAATSTRESSGVTWADLTQPWAAYTQPWSSFSQTSQLIDIASDVSGAVHLFGQAGGVQDNGQLISYSMTPGLMTQGPQQDIRPDSFDVFTQATTQLELATLQFDSLTYPDDPGTTILASPLNFNDPQTFVTPQTYPLVNAYSRYLRVTLSGISVSRACAYGGMRVYMNVQGRPSGFTR